MKRLRPFLPLMGLLLVFGFGGIARFSQDVRSVVVVGLSGGGFALGVAFAFLVLGFSGRIKPKDDPGRG